MSQFTFVPISPLTLTSHAPVGVNIYSWQQGAKEEILFLASDQSATSEALEWMSSTAELKLFIHQNDCDEYQKYLRSHCDEWLQNDAMPIQSKAAILSEVVRNVLSNEFARNDTMNIVGASKQLGKQMARVSSDQSLLCGELCQILHHDYGTFTHSANVGFYCSLIAVELGFPAPVVEELATGGLLHDLGKLDIDDRILNKPGKLDEFEFKTIKEHPVTGFRRLTKVTETTTTQMLMAYQHHERLDGKGYPVGLTGDEIDIAAKICSVADVFEAMTSNRPYRKAMTRKQALDLMNESVGTAFDKEVFQCWSSIVNRRMSS
jgi:HD-GYP domain-containing protein (c-di-GMP phosphodiesterase class II)